MTNYEKAKSLLANGIAEQHYTYAKTGIITINLGGDWCEIFSVN